MFTRRFADAPDLKAEFGAMRVIPDEHRRIVKAANDLGLTVSIYILSLLPLITIVFYKKLSLRIPTTMVGHPTHN